MRPQIEKPGLEAGVTNLLDLIKHAKESIEASGINRPCIRLRPQLDAGFSLGPRLRWGADAKRLPAAHKAAFCISCRLVIIGRACLYIVGISYRELCF